MSILLLFHTWFVWFAFMSLTRALDSMFVIQLISSSNILFFLFFKVFCMVSADASRMDFFLSVSRYFPKHCTSWWTERVLVSKDNWIILFAKCEFLLSELVHYQNMLFSLLFKMCAIISDSLIHSFVHMMWMEFG